MNATGKMMVGYRYGKAPESGRSYNHSENKYEIGVSMAKTGHMDELGSFAVLNLKGKKVKKYYYAGTIAGEGGDAQEICLVNIDEITYKQYKEMLKNEEIINASNEIANYIADRKINLINGGWSIGATKEKVEEWREKNVK